MDRNRPPAVKQEWDIFLAIRDQSARVKLIEYYRYLVHVALERFFSKYGNVDLGNDLYQDGAIGLIRAIDNFDPSRGVSFQTYATRLIDFAIQEGLRRESHVPRSITSKRKLLLKARQQAETHTAGCSLTHQEMAKALGLSLDAFEDLKTAAKLWRIVPIETQTGDKAGDDLGSTLVGPNDTYEEAWKEYYCSTIRQAIEQLPQPKKCVVLEYIFKDKTFKQIARGFGRSESWACQIYHRALSDLRPLLVEFSP